VPRRTRRDEKVIRKELKVVEKAIALLDERKRTLSANYLGESDSQESLRLHDELAAVTGELNEAEEKWVRLQEELEAAN
jgi:ATP-binding cassette subfamily F protein 3